MLVSHLSASKLVGRSRRQKPAWHIFPDYKKLNMAQCKRGEEACEPGEDRMVLDISKDLHGLLGQPEHGLGFSSE